MERVLTVTLLSVLGFNLGLLLMRLFGAPADEGPLGDAAVRLRSENPSRR